MTFSAGTIRFVSTRAASRCEYCKMHQSLQGATFHLEHVIPRSRGGTSRLANLAWACPSCNLHKSNRVEVVDPDSGTVTTLFHPRRDRWEEHFEWDGIRVKGKTAVGRATVATLDLNHPRRQRIPEAEIDFGLLHGQTSADPG